MQDTSDRTRCVDTITTSKRLQWLLNLLIPIIHPFYFTHNEIHLEVVAHMPLTTCYLIYMHATCMHCMVYAHGYLFFQEIANKTRNNLCRSYLARADISCGFFVGHLAFRTYLAFFWVICVGHIWLRTYLAMPDISSRNRAYL